MLGLGWQELLLLVVIAAAVALQVNAVAVLWWGRPYLWRGRASLRRALFWLYVAVVVPVGFLFGRVNFVEGIVIASLWLLVLLRGLGYLGRAPVS